MKRTGFLLAASIVLGIIIGCTVQIPIADSLFSIGSPFVLKGTATVVQNEGNTCRLWLGENGIAYYLFQDPRVDNDVFDRVISPGVTSRLELVIRADLPVTCHDGQVAEVLDVLEIEE